MQLLDWIEAEKAAGRKVNFSTIGRALGKTPQTIECHAKGYKRPAPDTILAYEKLTAGQVTLADWVAVEKRERPAGRAA